MNFPRLHIHVTVSNLYSNTQFFSYGYKWIDLLFWLIFFGDIHFKHIIQKKW